MNERYKKTKKGIQELSQDMILASGIKNDKGVLILSAGTLLNNQIKKKLEKRRINEVWVYSEEEEKNVQEEIPIKKMEDIKFNKKEDTSSKTVLFTQNKKVVENILADVEKGELVSLDTMTCALNVLMKQFDSNTKILQAIEHFRNADNHLYTHCINVALLCFLMGKWLDMEKGKIQNLICAGLLHDIGKTTTFEGAKQEADEEKIHPAVGYRMIKKIPGIDEEVLQGILMHHEREDGLGYPFALEHDKIHEFAKIIAIVDTYDLLVTSKIGKEKESAFKVLEIFEKESFGKFAPHYLSVFLRNIANYYLGDKVYLNTGEEGEIIFVNSKHVSKPLIRVGDRYIDTLKDTSIYIV
ncbi:HDIG domain-containing protein [Anaerovirgula multivorans]|uniref:HDIG domain-containing protein n=1 Tax=Anaerovirgula multivorans TaxID=312168 RepID=A0A239CFN4_9FIRM|nr:HD domain-containing phosphohydrolase [Anaerovirgula multivorans]SNS18488.1 HDIG domain-containing protein [Anaerovirgula multivorans]